jgi:hypothetical protein
MSQPISLNETLVLHLNDGLDMRVVAADPELWQRRDAPELAEGRLMSIFSYDSTWDYEERHPDGDELALVLEGAVDLLLGSGAGAKAVPLAAGEAGIVPAGSWHHLAVHQPSTILFITPVPARTEHRTRPATHAR